ncbi:Der GTPase-activating protein YihI [Muribacter muris]|uniref:Der GTPase-activating protein YihI n=1 Tax=Muribacter muris TaxID=67855 RepID=A0A4Y9K8J4_9PAST|nr:Der GTPase-activating protein YihI [Muribacter muris]MBF0784310.1 Der GTPase-activating protein YihI [Muribacter muris]MBF0826953.1 Der GTPase-activating protein YihI [Muribacter muris]TFV13047.1 Der GTPase-activating protein YihI [Muribacter muris]
MSRQKKTRRITDIMPARKVEKKPYEQSKAKPSKNRKPTRYELDLAAKEEKKKRKHKGLPSGSRANEGVNEKKAVAKEVKDPRIGSRKKVPLMVEFVNQPEKGKFIKPVAVEETPRLAPEVELEQLESNECLNQLLDDLEAGKTLSPADQKFVDDCLERVHQLMTELGIEDEDESDDALLRQFETLDINQFR